MRILFLTNFYPPYGRGGYEERCFETAAQLRQRGHTVAVLTSTYRGEDGGTRGRTGVPAGAGRRQAEPEAGVYRVLRLESDLLHYRPLSFFTTRRKEERENEQLLLEQIERFQPEVMFVWGMWNLSRRLPAVVERRGYPPVVYSISDLWPAEPDRHTAYWRRPVEHGWMRLPKQALSVLAARMQAAEGQPALRFSHAIIVSRAIHAELLKAGLPLENAEVVHGGIDLDMFPQKAGPAPHARPERALRLLYAGGLGRHKGVHTAVEALELLKRRGSQGWQVTLTIVGSGHPAYERELEALAGRLGVAGQVSFQARVPRQAMPGVYAAHDVLVFPSIWEEPLARAPMEAMASGLVVIGTATGGTKEMLVDGENGLVFPPDDADALAGAIERLAADAQLYARLQQAGRRTVEADFTLGGMVDRMEACLIHACLAQPGQQGRLRNAGGGAGVDVAPNDGGALDAGGAAGESSRVEVG